MIGSTKQSTFREILQVHTKLIMKNWRKCNYSNNFRCNCKLSDVFLLYDSSCLWVNNCNEKWKDNVLLKKMLKCYKTSQILNRCKNESYNEQKNNCACDIQKSSSLLEHTCIYIYIQGVPLILVQTLRRGRGHEDKHY